MFKIIVSDEQFEEMEAILDRPAREDLPKFRNLLEADND